MTPTFAIAAGIALSLTASVLTGRAAAQAPSPRMGVPPPAVFAAGQRILFQGDSITDGGRGRGLDPNHILGQDYVLIIAGSFGASYPERNLTFLNRGISGNTVEDLAARWQVDTLDLKPDVLSVLVGVNDMYFAFLKNKPLSVETYEKSYDDLLAKTVAANPKVRLVLCEPFILPGKNTTPRWDEWSAVAKQLRDAVARLGAKYHAPVVHFQKIFDDAAAKGNTPADYWIWDGIHPTYSGHQRMADEWIRAYSDFYGITPMPAK